ncbi:hypothetical protein DL96DRAFT_1683033 [Flagelloscypha sp. PMI_526]|nr:hypothetical protein DL96DRAFT_1683033 [Flagelloscypha sp. PMI_526]
MRHQTPRFFSFLSGIAICSVLVLSSATGTHQDSTVFAEQYGRPLIEFARLAQILVAGLGTNSLSRTSALADPNQQAVVLPNVDTLYGSAIIDLSEHDVVLTVPEVDDTDRFFVFAFYDPFGSNFANVGRTSNAQAGTYLVRRACDAKVEWGYSQADSNDKYKGYINMPTTQGSLLVRILVKNNTTDLDAVRSVLQSANVATVDRPLSPGRPASPITNATFAGLGDYSALAILTLTARLMEANPPFNMTDPEKTIATLQHAGLYNGMYHQPSDVNLTAAFSSAISAAQAYATGPGLTQLNNNWAYIQPTGLFGDLLTARTITAIKVYLELVGDEAIYPAWEGQLSLQAGEAYIYKFTTKPPLQEYGFWSLTLYNETGYLVNNVIDKYTVGDRSNITYPDGELVYGEGSEDPEKPFEILVQSETPPSNWTANWLPAPAEGGIIQVTLRLYGHQAGVVDGSWQYPMVSEVKAFTDSA